MVFFLPNTMAIPAFNLSRRKFKIAMAPIYQKISVIQEYLSAEG